VGHSLSVRKRRKSFEFSAIKLLEARVQLAVIAEIIDVCRVLTEIDFKDLLTQFFAPYDIHTVRRQLAILVAMGVIKRSPDAHIVAVRDSYRLLTFDPDARVRLKARWHSAYSEHMPPILRVADEYE
jgi:hypothetical protein